MHIKGNFSKFLLMFDSSNVSVKYTNKEIEILHYYITSPLWQTDSWIKII